MKQTQKHDDTAVGDVIENVVEQQDEEKKEIDEWKDKCLRAYADYHNLVRRTERDREEAQKFAGEVIVGKLLPVLDNFERAQTHLNDEGLRIALKEFSAVLISLGVEKIETDDAHFDPYTMDCVDVVEGTPETVVTTIESGYTMHGKVIRPAKVTVGKKEEEKV